MAQLRRYVKCMQSKGMYIVWLAGFKGGLISECIFNLVEKNMNERNPQLSNEKWKSKDSVISFIFLRMGPNWKYLLRISRLYLWVCVAVVPWVIEISRRIRLTSASSCFPPPPPCRRRPHIAQWFKRSKTRKKLKKFLNSFCFACTLGLLPCLFLNPFCFACTYLGSFTLP